jgi:Ni,Fe-hydrogenase III large subunit
MTDRSPIAVADVASKAAPSADGFLRLTVDAATWTALAKGCADGLNDFAALWFDDGVVRMALIDCGKRIRSIVALDVGRSSYPSVGRYHPPAIRLERAMRDLYGIEPKGLPDDRPWLDHGVWPIPPPGRRPSKGETKPYVFLPAEGESLHQIPVGPVHAGIIEPGHFRFTANGETVVRLEERLGYVHKGIEALAAGADIEQAGRIVARISGDSTVAYGFAFARAVEAALGWQPPERAIGLRGIMAELERISHHVNDVGAICNDASVVALHARCLLIREDILRTAGKCFGHRMMMDCVVPGGVSCDLATEGIGAIRDLLRRCEAGLREVSGTYDELPSLQDRTVATGKTRPELIRQFAAGGYVGRAAGRAFDARSAFPYPPYDGLSFKVPTREAGDVNARIWIRIEEVGESIGIVRQLLDRMKPGPIRSGPPKAASGEAAGFVEAFRGDVFVWVRLDARGRVAHLHARDASWFQWPLLESAIEGNIVADFPLCNKSFNCSYSGHDI